MKPPYRILLPAVCLPFLFTACSLTSLIQEESRREQVRVYLADGSVLEGKAKLPDLEDRNIRIVAEDKGRSNIKAADIKALAFRQGKSGDKRDIFRYSKYQDGSRTAGPFWMKLVGSGPHLDICLCGAYYSYGKNGEMEVRSSFNDRIYIIAFVEDRPAQLIGYEDSRISTLRSKLLDLLGDDSELCRRLQERELSVKDYQGICRDYEPERGEGVWNI